MIMKMFEMFIAMHMFIYSELSPYVYYSISILISLDSFLFILSNLSDTKFFSKPDGNAKKMSCLHLNCQKVNELSQTKVHFFIHCTNFWGDYKLLNLGNNLINVVSLENHSSGILQREIFWKKEELS